MKLCISRLNTKLAVVINCFAPDTLATVDPSSASVTFVKQSATGFAASALGTVDLEQIDGITGVWGALIDIQGVDVSNLVVIAGATVGGVAMREVEILGRSVNTGSPSILVEATDKAGRPNFGISE